MSQTILYYPYINIQDGAWLRNAILYWDEVSSIVPSEYYEDFSPELLYLQNMGIYNAVYPQDLFYSEYSKEFHDSIEKRIACYERSITKNHDKIQKGISEHAQQLMIYYEKVPKNLLKFLKDKGLISDSNNDGRVEMASKVAQIYMRTLAEYSIKCSDKDMVLGTDTLEHHREIYRSNFCSNDKRAQCCKINILDCLPQPSMDVSFEDILDFKEKRKDELYAFREKIRELETNIYKSESMEQIRHYESQFIESWENCSKDFYKVLKDSRIEFFLSSLVSIVALPFAGQFLSETVGPVFSSAIQTGAPLLKIGIDYYNYKNKISPAKSDGGFSYIFKANRDGIIQI